MRNSDTPTVVEAILFGAVMGAGLGAILGLLLASQRGAGLRDDIRTGIGTLVDGAKRFVNPARGKPTVTLQDGAQVQRDENAMLPFAGSIM